MITKEQAKSIQFGHILYHVTVKNSNGTPARCRVNGKCKTWKTRPDEFRLPVKYGMYDYFYITDTNAKEWYDPEFPGIIPFKDLE